MKTIIICLKIWSALGIVFLGWFLMAHLFSNEPMIFNNKKELVTFLFFPLGILLGLLISFRWEMIGGLICLISVIVSLMLIPDLIFNPYFILFVLPGILLLLTEFRKISI